MNLLRSYAIMSVIPDSLYIVYYHRKDVDYQFAGQFMHRNGYGGYWFKKHAGYMDPEGREANVALIEKAEMRSMILMPV